MTDSLESRLERLSPEQRRSVEDYVDFLISRPAAQGGNPGISPAAPLPVAAPPPLLSLHEMDQPGTSLPACPQEPVIIPRDDSASTKETESSGIQEIATEREDTSSGGYMDYGKFELPQNPPPSPADEAVRRVKVKLDRKKGDKPADSLLEWV